MVNQTKLAEALNQLNRIGYAVENLFNAVQMDRLREEWDSEEEFDPWRAFFTEAKNLTDGYEEMMTQYKRQATNADQTERLLSELQERVSDEQI